MLIVRSNSSDVYRNLAVEEWLLDHAPQRPILFLCVNDPCVVIGKNQNPWCECRLSLMDRDDVPLARRISGGGAVYHDPGNLNVSIIVDRTHYVEQKQYDLIFQTLETFGIRALKLGKNSLAVDGLKFSGQAFCHRRDRTLHHGTLLVEANLDHLGRYLGPELENIETNAVASVPAEVTNLNQFNAGLTVEMLSDALIQTFRNMYGVDDAVEFWSDTDVQTAARTQFLPMVGKNSATDWTLGRTPRFIFGGVEVVNGLVADQPFDAWRKGGSGGGT